VATIGTAGNARAPLLEKGHFDIQVNNSHDQQPDNHPEDHVFSLMIFISFHCQAPINTVYKTGKRTNALLVDR
jgi:hypothetical protein